MYLEIVTPEATLFSGEVDSVAVPGVLGEFEMLNNHAAIISLLEEGFVKLYGNITLNGNVADRFQKSERRQGYFLPITSGTVEMKDNHVVVLAD
ncbi:F-type H+-transporting ATPase subunit epsilon [Flavobacteriaceae bacterium MAR_2010_188]|nr:F-type H+-transporting ATPase subunit epsilon [Flavobacteriaceae bacterium MAR_2010_188]